MGLALAKDIGEVTRMKRAYIAVGFLLAALWFTYSKFNSSYEAAHQQPPPVRDSPPSDKELRARKIGQRLSPSKLPARQDQLLRQAEVRLRVSAAVIKSRYGVQIVDSDGKQKDTWDALLELSKVLRARSRESGPHGFVRHVVQELGLDLGLALYRAVKVDGKEEPTDCSDDDVKVSQEETLVRTVCTAHQSADKCKQLLDDLGEFMAIQYPTVSKTLGTHYIDDYGDMCRPLDTLIAYTEYVRSKLPDAKSRTSFFVRWAGTDAGLALLKISLLAALPSPPPVAQKPSKPLHQKQRLRALRAVEGDLL